METTVSVFLTKIELEVLRNALYAHRELVRSQERLALQTRGKPAERDADRFGKIIKESLKLDDKLSDAVSSFRSLKY